MQTIHDRIERAKAVSEDIETNIKVDYKDLWGYMKENDYSLILKLYDILKKDWYGGIWEAYQLILDHYFANLYFRKSIDTSNDIESWKSRYMRTFLMKFIVWLEEKWVIYDYGQKEEGELKNLYTKFNRNESK